MNHYNENEWVKRPHTLIKEELLTSRIEAVDKNDILEDAIGQVNTLNLTAIALCCAEAGPTLSPSETKEMPANFKRWQKTNASRIQGAMERDTLPHWIKDNYIPNADGSLFPLFGYPTQTARLKAFKARAKEMWQGKTFRDEITITNKGIKEWLNQPHKHKAEKDKAIFQIDELLSNAEYKGWVIDIHNSQLKSRIYEVKIGGDPSYLIVREFAWGRQLHSVTDSNSILKHIKDRQ